MKEKRAGGDGLMLTFTKPEPAPSSRTIAKAFGFEDETRRFNGFLQYQRVEEYGDPPTWRTLGPLHGMCSPVCVAQSVDFLLGDPRVTRVRVVWLADEASARPAA